jgi:hypothetical protein
LSQNNSGGSTTDSTTLADGDYDVIPEQGVESAEDPGNAVEDLTEFLVGGMRANGVERFHFCMRLVEEPWSGTAPAGEYTP